MIKLLILATLFTLSVSPVRAELPLKAEAPIPGSSVKTEPPIKVEVPSVSSAKTGLPIKGDVISINAIKTKPFHLKKLLRHIAMVPLVITEACCLGAAACPYGYYGDSYTPTPWISPEKVDNSKERLLQMRKYKQLEKIICLQVNIVKNLEKKQFG